VRTCLSHRLKISLQPAVAYSTQRRDDSKVKAAQRWKLTLDSSCPQPTHSTNTDARNCNRLQLLLLYLSVAGNQNWCPEHMGKSFFNWNPSPHRVESWESTSPLTHSPASTLRTFQLSNYSWLHLKPVSWPMQKSLYRNTQYEKIMQQDTSKSQQLQW
jgi:hypothetical protein